MALNHLQPERARSLVEERFFDMRLGDTGSLVKQALAEAAGMPLEELAPGMWSGSRAVSSWTTLDVTARAQAVEDGTSIELRVEHRSNPLAMGLALLLIIAAAIPLLPLIPIIMFGQREQKRQQRERLVLMHKLWTEIGEVVGAPRRASYRETPQRAYAPGQRIAVQRSAGAAAPAARIAEPVAAPAGSVPEPSAARAELAEAEADADQAQVLESRRG